MLDRDQARVATNAGAGLAVSAGAGSGKTRALAHRYARALLACEEREGRARPDSVLAITFTERAASELKDRVEGVLGELAGPAATLCVDEAWVSTIHGFCARVLRRHAEEAEVDPRVAIADETRAGVLLERAFQQVARDRLARCGARSLLSRYAAGQVRSAVRHLLGQVRSLGLSVQDVAVDDPVVLPGAMRRAVQALQVGASGDEGPGFAAWLAGCVRCGGVDPEEVLARARGARPRRGDGRAPDPAAREAVAALADVAAETVAASYARELLALAGEVDAEYGRLKERDGLLDFADLELATARLFADRPDVARAYRDSFDAILVDEFQDTNPLQAAIVRAIARDNLCTVGDTRQSIYGFRFARPELLMGDDGPQGGSRRVGLCSNYRSHPDIVRFVNRLFGHDALFGRAHQRLRARRGPGAPVWAQRAPRVTLDLVDRRGTTAAARAREALLVADRARAIVARGAEPGDVAVLLRRATQARAYAGALRAAGLPVSLEARGGLFDTRVARELVALLRTLTDRDDEEALTSVLASRLVGMPLDMLARLRWDGGSGGLRAALRGRATGVAATLERLSDVALRESAASTLREAVSAFGLEASLLAWDPEGRRAVADVRGVIEHAEAACGGGLGPAAFVDHIETAAAAGVRMAPPERETGERAVRVMTIHAAKGLEFPAVIVPDLAVGPAASREAFLLDVTAERVRLVGRAPALPERGLFDTTPTRSFGAVQDARKHREREEEKRILYVACTRARETLSLVGAADLSRRAGASTLVDLVRAALGLGGPVAEWGERPAGTCAVRVHDACEGV